jgi:hypothetical protein
MLIPDSLIACAVVYVPPCPGNTRHGYLERYNQGISGSPRTYILLAFSPNLFAYGGSRDVFAGSMAVHVLNACVVGIPTAVTSHPLHEGTSHAWYPWLLRLHTLVTFQTVAVCRQRALESDRCLRVARRLCAVTLSREPVIADGVSSLPGAWHDNLRDVRDLQAIAMYHAAQRIVDSDRVDPGVYMCQCECVLEVSAKTWPVVFTSVKVVKA